MRADHELPIPSLLSRLNRAINPLAAMPAHAAPASTGQAVPAQEAGRNQPQTTIQAPGGPFIRHAEPGRRLIYTRTGDTVGSTVTQPIPSVPGYLRSFRVRITASGGVGTGTAAVSGADQPFNIATNVIVRDPFGTVLIQGPGYEVFKLIPMFGGQLGLDALSDPANLPSFSAVATTGNFTFASCLPFEFAKGYGMISGANASLLPQIYLYGNGSPYGTAPGTLPTLETNVEGDFYWLPEGEDILPPGLGTTAQWSFAQGNPAIGSGSNTSVIIPRLGGYVSTLIFILRDSTSARIDPFTGVTDPSFQLRIDGVPVTDTLWRTFLDDMQIQFAGAAAAQWARPTGVWAWTRKTSMSQKSLGLLDTGEVLLSTNPGTSVELFAPNWGTISNAPATLNVMMEIVVPTGSIIQGLPEV